MLSNITAGTSQQLQICIDENIVDILVQLLQHDEVVVQNEAVWALSNTTASANAEQFKTLTEKGIIKALGSTLISKDVRMLAVALEGLDNILDCGQKNYIDDGGENMFALITEREGILDYLEELQQHPNHDIYTSALQIIEKYFQTEEEGHPLMSALDNAIGQAAGSTPAQGKGLFDL